MVIIILHKHPNQHKRSLKIRNSVKELILAVQMCVCHHNEARIQRKVHERGSRRCERYSEFVYRIAEQDTVSSI